MPDKHNMKKYFRIIFLQVLLIVIFMAGKKLKYRKTSKRKCKNGQTWIPISQ